MNQPTHNALKIFLCHCSEDKPKVRKLYQYLLKQGYDAWLDEENLLAGQDWSLEIQKKIRTTDIVIVVLSEKSVSKEGYVQKEIKIALDAFDEKPENSIFIIPLRLDDCEIPPSLKRLHALDLNKKDSGKKLMDALDARATSIGKNKHLEINAKPVSTHSQQETPNSEIKKEQIKELPTNFGDSNTFLYLASTRFTSLLGSLLAAFTLRLVSGEYYQPNDSSILSNTARLIVNSEFTFALLIVIAMVSSGFEYHYIDSVYLNKIEIPIPLRYFISLPAGYLLGGFADILAALLVPIFLFILGLAIILFLGWIGSETPSNSSSGLDSSKKNIKFIEHNLGEEPSKEFPSFNSKNTIKPYKPKNIIIPIKVNCLSCKGTGNSKMECNACKGTGFSKNGIVKCFHCKGSGKLKCMNCDGKGKVEIGNGL